MKKGFTNLGSLPACPWFFHRFYLCNSKPQEDAAQSIEVSMREGERVETIKEGLGDPHGNILFLVLSLHHENKEGKQLVVLLRAFQKTMERSS